MVFVGIDVSSSFPERDILSCLEKVNKKLKSGKIYAVVIQCNHDIVRVDYRVREIKPRDIVTILQGGTDLTKILEFIEKHHPGQHELILITDGYTSWRESSSVKTSVIYVGNISKEDHLVGTTEF